MPFLIAKTVAISDQIIAMAGRIIEFSADNYKLYWMKEEHPAALKDIPGIIVRKRLPDRDWKIREIVHLGQIE